MSFDMNLISTRNLSNVQASSKSQDGGAGNTGYFMRGEEDEDIGLRFKDSEGDVFKRTIDAEEKEENNSFVDLLFKFIECIVEKIKKILNIK